MKLYNVSTDLDLNERDFTPRVPKTVMAGEDESISRICMSSEIGKALQSMPDSYDGVYNRHSKQSKNLIPSLFTIFEIDAYDISDSLLVFPSTLTSTGLVPDAEKFQEYWVKKAFSSKPAKVMWLKELEIDLCTGEVLSFEIELSTEPVERIFTFTFRYKNELEVMKEMIQALSLPSFRRGCIRTLFRRRG